MPFAQRFDDVHVAIHEAVESVGLDPVRADDIFTTRASLEKILRGIAEAEVIVADMTGRNPNVYYEVRVAHTVKENVVILAQNVEEDVPFDLRHIDYLQYANTVEGRTELTTRLSSVLQSLAPEPELASPQTSIDDGLGISFSDPQSQVRVTINVDTTPVQARSGTQANQAEVHVEDLRGDGDWWLASSGY